MSFPTPLFLWSVHVLQTVKGEEKEHRKYTRICGKKRNVEAWPLTSVLHTLLKSFLSVTLVCLPWDIISFSLFTWFTRFNNSTKQIFLIVKENILFLNFLNRMQRYKRNVAEKCRIMWNNQYDYLHILPSYKPHYLKPHVTRKLLWKRAFLMIAKAWKGCSIVIESPSEGLCFNIFIRFLWLF